MKYPALNQSRMSGASNGPIREREGGEEREREREGEGEKEREGEGEREKEREGEGERGGE